MSLQIFSRVQHEGVSLLEKNKIECVVHKAKISQKIVAQWSEKRINDLRADLAQRQANYAKELALLTVEETSIGTVQVQRQQILGAVEEQNGNEFTEYANSVGVILGMLPITNVCDTIISMMLQALQSRNALILSPNRMALKLAKRNWEIVIPVLKKHRVPAGFIHIITEVTSKASTEVLLQHPKIDLIIKEDAISKVIVEEETAAEITK